MRPNAEFLKSPVYRATALALSAAVTLAACTPTTPQKTDTSTSNIPATTAAASPTPPEDETLVATATAEPSIRVVTPVASSRPSFRNNENLLLIGECQPGGILDVNQRANRIKHTKIIAWVLDRLLSPSAVNSYTEPDLDNLLRVAQKHTPLTYPLIFGPEDDDTLCTLTSNFHSYRDNPENPTSYEYDFQGVAVDLKDATLRRIYGPRATGAINIKVQFVPGLIQNTPFWESTDPKFRNPYLDPFVRYKLSLLLGNGGGKPFIDQRDLESVARAWFDMPSAPPSVLSTSTTPYTSSSGSREITIEKSGRILDGDRVITWTAEDIGWTSLEVINPRNFR